MSCNCVAFIMVYIHLCTFLSILLYPKLIEDYPLTSVPQCPSQCCVRVRTQNQNAIMNEWMHEVKPVILKGTILKPTNTICFHTVSVWDLWHAISTDGREILFLSPVTLSPLPAHPPPGIVMNHKRFHYSLKHPSLITVWAHQSCHRLHTSVLFGLKKTS